MEQFEHQPRKKQHWTRVENFDMQCFKFHWAYATPIVSNEIRIMSYYVFTWNVAAYFI